MKLYIAVHFSMRKCTAPLRHQTWISPRNGQECPTVLLSHAGDNVLEHVLIPFVISHCFGHQRDTSRTCRKKSTLGCSERPLLTLRTRNIEARDHSLHKVFQLNQNKKQ